MIDQDEYEAVFQKSLENPENFWREHAENISWYKKWDEVLERSDGGLAKWFKGGELNTCYNAVDRHVEIGRGNQTALIYESPVTNTIEKFSYLELKKRVSKIAGFLKYLGVRKGDTVIIYMPMIPEALMAMLACARIGAIHSVVFGGFSAIELSKRINEIDPEVILSASCGIEPDKLVQYKPMLDRAIELADRSPERCVIYQREESRASILEGRDLPWRKLEKRSEPVSCAPVSSDDPLYILYTSGTTGKPSGIVRDNGGHAVALHWSMKYIYGIKPGDVFWTATDIGWVAGHSYIVYGPLIRGATTVLYEGKPVGTPDPGIFWRIISRNEVNVLSTAPTVIRAIKRGDPKGEFFRKGLVSSLDSVFLAGERTDMNTYRWLDNLLGIPIIDHWWQTETGWPAISNLRGMDSMPIKPKSVTKPMPGYDIKILDLDDGVELPTAEEGLLAIRRPLPPGSLVDIWNEEEVLKEIYFNPNSQYYNTGDSGYIDEDGYVFITGRVDDIINVAGHRLSTCSMEDAIMKYSVVSECAVVGVKDELKGEVPMAFIVLISETDQDKGEIIEEVKKLIRKEVGPIASFKKVIIIGSLPKTRSGKILRKTLKEIVNQGEYEVSSTVKNEIALQEIKRIFDD
ncbi:MAG: AMP-binding protein [Candidatus Saliniplasma sp.]